CRGRHGHGSWMRQSEKPSHSPRTRCADFDCRRIALENTAPFATALNRSETELTCEDWPRMLTSLRSIEVLTFRSEGQDSLSGCERESWLSLAMRSKDSPLDLIRYWNCPSSGGRRRTISYCCPTVGTPIRGGAKLTNCPTLNLWVAMSLSAAIAQAAYGMN